MDYPRLAKAFLVMAMYLHCGVQVEIHKIFVSHHPAWDAFKLVTNRCAILVCDRFEYFAANSITTNILQRQLKHWLILVGMGQDAADGNITWAQHDISVQFEQSKSPVFKSIYQSLKQLKIISNRRAWFLPQVPMTVHPLGGARIGMNVEQGVVDGHGEVFGHLTSILPMAAHTSGNWHSTIHDDCGMVKSCQSGHFTKITGTQ
jgi:hypothetical protein